MSQLKTLHILTVVISISGFIIRGIWMMKDSPMQQRRWVKIAPHINDTVLLITGISLAISIQQYPFVHGWLTAKILALLIYIGLGMVSLKTHYSKKQRITTWVIAIIVFSYMILVARTHQAFYFL